MEVFFVQEGTRRDPYNWLSVDRTLYEFAYNGKNCRALEKVIISTEWDYGQDMRWFTMRPPAEAGDRLAILSL